MYLYHHLILSIILHFYLRVKYKYFQIVPLHDRPAVCTETLQTTQLRLQLKYFTWIRLVWKSHACAQVSSPMWIRQALCMTESVVIHKFYPYPCESSCMCGCVIILKFYSRSCGSNCSLHSTALLGSIIHRFTLTHVNQACSLLAIGIGFGAIWLSLFGDSAANPIRCKSIRFRFGHSGDTQPHTSITLAGCNSAMTAIRAFLLIRCFTELNHLNCPNLVNSSTRSIQQSWWSGRWAHLTSVASVNC